MVGVSTDADTNANSRGTVPTTMECIDSPAQFSFSIERMINEIEEYKLSLQIGNDAATLTLPDIAKFEQDNASFSDALMKTLTTDLRVQNERAKVRFFYVKFTIAYEVAFRYATTNSVDVKVIPGKPSRIGGRLEEG